MKEKIEKYRWLILVVGFILLSIGGMVYQSKMSQEKIYLSESIKEVEEQQDNLLNMEELVAQVEEKPPTIVSTEKSLEQEKDIKSSKTVEKDIKEEMIHEVPIYICGEVKKPGVYYVNTDSIVNDLVVISGGFTEEANRVAVNLASPIEPNEKIIIPKQGEEIDKLVDSYDNIEGTEVSHGTKEAVSKQSQSSMIHINTASKEEFMTLSGIGEVKAEAIIAYRQENGGFNSIEEVKNISGIGEKTFEKIKPFITIE